MTSIAMANTLCSLLEKSKIYPKLNKCKTCECACIQNKVSERSTHTYHNKKKMIFDNFNEQFQHKQRLIKSNKQKQRLYLREQQQGGGSLETISKNPLCDNKAKVAALAAAAAEFKQIPIKIFNS